MKNNFWRQKKILITGYEGFLGSHLTKKLIKFKAKILGLDIKIHRKKTILEKSDYKNIKVFKGSVTNSKLLAQIIKGYRPEFIFHLAAEAIVGKCLQSPIKAFSTNIKGAWILLEAIRKNASKIKGIIIASSDKAYGIKNNLPYHEADSLAGIYPYDVSKSCADLLAQSYFQTFHLPLCITRCGNIFGPGDFNFSRIVPDTILSALSNKTLFIRSNGKYTRDYIYVEDIVDGYLLLAEKMRALKLFGQAFNFSHEKPLSVLELVKIIYALAKKKPKYKILGKADCEIKDQYLSSKKAKKILGWQPQYSLEEGLKITFNWYRKNYDKSR